MSKDRGIQGLKAKEADREVSRAREERVEDIVSEELDTPGRNRQPWEEETMALHSQYGVDVKTAAELVDRVGYERVRKFRDLMPDTPVGEDANRLLASIDSGQHPGLVLAEYLNAISSDVDNVNEGLPPDFALLASDRFLNENYRADEDVVYSPLKRESDARLGGIGTFIREGHYETFR